MTLTSTPLKLYARWANDCQGKKDYDGPIIEISTRYWPEGGGFYILDENRQFRSSTNPSIKPSAHCSLVIAHGLREKDDGGPDTETLAEVNLTGNSFEEVARSVETFAQDQMDFVVKTLRAAYLTRTDSKI